jgi:hypothetical protein
MLANKKSDLMKNGDLREDCVWNIVLILTKEER